MTDEEHQNFCAFMNRVQLTGAEVSAWAAVVNAVTSLRASVNRPPGPEPKAPSGEQ